MILLTYRINQKNWKEKSAFTDKAQFFHTLYFSVLRKDSFWHYFFDPDGATLRFTPSFEKRVRNWLIKNCQDKKFSFRRAGKYEPRRHEYYGISFLSDDILPLFHEMSVLSVKYPRNVILWPLLERLTHGLINMNGIHDFEREAHYYLALATMRAELGRVTLPLPTWLYKLYFKMNRFFRR